MLHRQCGTGGRLGLKIIEVPPGKGGDGGSSGGFLDFLLTGHYGQVLRRGMGWQTGRKFRTKESGVERSFPTLLVLD